MRDAGAWRRVEESLLRKGGKGSCCGNAGVGLCKDGIGFCVSVLEKGQTTKKMGTREKLQSVNVRRSEYDKTGVCVRASGIETCERFCNSTEKRESGRERSSALWI